MILSRQHVMCDRYTNKPTRFVCTLQMADNPKIPQLLKLGCTVQARPKTKLKLFVENIISSMKSVVVFNNITQRSQLLKPEKY